jgi:hypothetical protein
MFIAIHNWSIVAGFLTPSSSSENTIRLQRLGAYNNKQHQIPSDKQYYNKYNDQDYNKCNKDSSNDSTTVVTTGTS